MCGASFDCSGEETNTQAKAADTACAGETCAASDCCKAPPKPATAQAELGVPASVSIESAEAVAKVVADTIAALKENASEGATVKATLVQNIAVSTVVAGFGALAADKKKEVVDASCDVVCGEDASCECEQKTAPRSRRLGSRRLSAEDTLELDVAREVPEDAAPPAVPAPADLQQSLAAELTKIDDTLQVEEPTTDTSFSVVVEVADAETTTPLDLTTLKASAATGLGVDASELTEMAYDSEDGVVDTPDDTTDAPTKDGCKAPSDACVKACEDKKVGPAQVTLICPPLKTVCEKACEAVEGKVGKGDECKQAIATATAKAEKCELPGTDVFGVDAVDSASSSAVSMLAVAVALVAALN